MNEHKLFFMIKEKNVNMITIERNMENYER